jgi:hypothetical protein
VQPGTCKILLYTRVSPDTETALRPLLEAIVTNHDQQATVAAVTAKHTAVDVRTLQVELRPAMALGDVAVIVPSARIEEAWPLLVHQSRAAEDQVREWAEVDSQYSGTGLTHSQAQEVQELLEQKQKEKQQSSG